MRSDNDREAPETAPPSWIDALLLAAAFLAATAVLLLLWSSGERHRLLHRTPIADFTVNLGGRPVREHCTTCHVEEGLPRQTSTGANSAPHPDIAPHATERLGCSGCHLGEGMALDRTLSHGLPGLGARQVLAGRDVQGRCFACHAVGPLAGAEDAWAGYRLFRQKACDLCHHLHGGPGLYGFGPELSSVGSQLGLSQLEEAIRDPDRKPVNSIMPRFPLSSAQVRRLALFLKSRVADPLSTSPMWVAAGLPGLPEVEMLPAEERVTGPGALLWQGGCLACHRFGDEDGRIAPDLSHIGRLRDADYLRDFLELPARRIPGAIMPTSSLNGDSRQELVSFLAGTGGDHVRHPLPTRQIYMHLCQRCHAANGDGRGLIQPNLANFPRPFADNAEFFRRTDDRRLRDSIARGIPGTSMPPYGDLLPPAAREQLLDLVFAAFIGVPRTAKIDLLPLPERPPVLDIIRADTLFNRHCVRCHGRTATGNGPESQGLLPHPRDLTNTPYFSALDDHRILRAILDGVPGTAMPAWRGTLGDDDAWGLVEQVRKLSGGPL